jgi:hypothetical protein
MGNANQGQVYFDPATGQYYTLGSGVFGSLNYNRNQRSYIGSPINQNKPSQTVTDMLARANAAAQNVNTPTLASLFPSMSFGQSQTPMMGGGQLAGGQFGAGRFLGQNASQFGNPAMPMGGFAGNTNNTTT